MRVKIRYHWLFGTLTLALSGTSLLIQLFLAPADLIQLLSSVFLISLGLLLLVSSYFEISDHALHLKLIAGMTFKIYPLQHLSDLVIEGDKIFVVRGMAREQIWGVLRFLAHPRDWGHLHRILSAAREEIES